jgi:pyridoxine/pyridoxamine 5'-phosphate oxidase
MTDQPENSYGDTPQAPDFSETGDPLALFAAWFGDARLREINDPDAMALATVDETGLPNVRTVLLKDFGPDGFVFYTNFESAKGRELLSGGKAALCFHWKSPHRRRCRHSSGRSPRTLPGTEHRRCVTADSGPRAYGCRRSASG